jgi:hypothetical protein
VLVIVGCITFVVIGWQSWESRRAADAAKQAAEAGLLNAQTLIASERAWVLVDIGNLPDFQPDANTVQILWIFPTIKNYGKTPARIKRVRGIVKLIPEGEELPATPIYAPGQGFDDKVNLVLPPDVPMQPRLGISGQEFIQVLGQKVTLYIHGSVDYLDVGEAERTSAYCYIYVIQGGFSPNKSGFYPAFDVPAAYTDCT